MDGEALFHSCLQRHSPNESQEAMQARTLARAHRTQQSITKHCYTRNNKRQLDSIHGDQMPCTKNHPQSPITPIKSLKHPRPITANPPRLLISSNHVSDAKVLVCGLIDTCTRSDTWSDGMVGMLETNIKIFP